jgi:hypothetical protein
VAIGSNRSLCFAALTQTWAGPWRRGALTALPSGVILGSTRGMMAPDQSRPASVSAGIPSFYEVAGCGLFVLCLVGPNAHAALLAFKNMSDISAFRFHDRFEESEPSCAEAAVMV